MVEVELSDGAKITLQKPTAGMRNKALIKADTAEGLKRTVLMVEMLPHCVKTHPWGTRPLREALDALSIEDYDKLIDGLSGLIAPKKGDVRKKSTGQSGQAASQKGGSEIK